GNDTYALKTTEANFIWDAVGTDTVTAAGASQPVTLYLQPGFWSYFGSQKATTITSAGQITINFGSVIENAVGTSYADYIVGSSAANSIDGGNGADSLEGAAGNDTLVGGPGDDTLSGGEGDDTALFSGNSSDYQIAVTDKATASLSIISRTEGTDKLSGIEFLKFSDKTIATSAYFDQTPPTIAITSNKASLKTGDTALISFTLSEAATDFTPGDVTVSGGTLTNFAGSGTNYTATFTPTANSTTNGVVSVASGKFSDAAGNFNADGADANNAVSMSVDTRLQTIQFASTSSSANEGNSGTSTITIDAVLSAASSQAVTVPITYSGTATTLQRASPSLRARLRGVQASRLWATPPRSPMRRWCLH
ncbi:MAG: hypothetical protein EB121_04070, partial [Alphaproteobacteria bacterium]|nr:hypothetical protein [Alphaproteobacteria bacterium]